MTRSWRHTRVKGLSQVMVLVIWKSIRRISCGFSSPRGRGFGPSLKSLNLCLLCFGNWLDEILSKLRREDINKSIKLTSNYQGDNLDESSPYQILNTKSRGKPNAGKPEQQIWGFVLLSSSNFWMHLWIPQGLFSYRERNTSKKNVSFTSLNHWKIRLIRTL